MHDYVTVYHIYEMRTKYKHGFDCTKNAWYIFGNISTFLDILSNNQKRANILANIITFLNF